MAESGNFGNAENRTLMLQHQLNAQRAAHERHPNPLYDERRQHLLNLKAWVLAHKAQIVAAIAKDYGNRSATETQLFEIYPILSGIDFVLNRLKKWMKPQNRHVDWMNFLGASNHVVPQPLGVVGIIVPWNFPLFLSLSPLTYVLAAGNRAMIKMSVNSSALAQLMSATFPNYFDESKIKIYADLEGGLGRVFSEQPFNHLIFTGSAATGSMVMAAASKNLCPVTLELGGKSPALLCPDFPLKTAMERILYAKFANAGQICVTVDHVYLPHTSLNEAVALAKEIVSHRYPTLDAPDYTSIISPERFEALIAMLQEAKAKGATVIPLIDGPAWDAGTHKIAPHVVLNAPENCKLMQEEIFGPILPMVTYNEVQEAVAAIQRRDGTPLAFYPFTLDKKLAHHVIEQIPSGGVSVNDCIYHVAQHDMPFGGMGSSGMGHYHGHEGFVTFSKLRPIFYQTRFSLTKLMWPPYGKFAKNYLRFLTRK